MATTMHRLSGGRYALGLGRGFDLLFDVMGLPRVTGAQMEDAIGIYRRLWHGEAFVGHDGPAGQLPVPAARTARFDEDIPVLMMAIGERTLELAGRVADGVVLHTFFTDETLARVGRDGPRARPSRPAGTRRRCGSGRCSAPSRSRSPRSCGCASWSVGSRPTSRATARCWCAPTAGTRADLERFRADDAGAAATRARSTRSARPSSSTYLRDEVLPARVAGRRGDRLAAAVRAPGSPTSSTPAPTA